MFSISQKTLGTFFALGLAAGGAVRESVAATILISSRDTGQTISFADTAAFSDATLGGSSVFAISGNAGDTYNFGYMVPHGQTGFSATVSPDFSVTPPILSSGIPNDIQAFTVTALNTPSAGTLTTKGKLGVNVAPSGAIESLSTGTNGGYNYLDEIFNPTGNQTSGGTFTFTVDIAGNYSAAGVGSGEHQLISINPLWSITQNFKFNGTDTVFSATINNYNPATDRIGLEYQIYGSAVPLPASAWLMLSGLVGLGFLGGKRRAA
jgi:hypothetical protein